MPIYRRKAEKANHRFFIVDVFGEKKCAGNPLAVVIPEGGIPGLPLFLFSPETYHAANAINARMFADAFGIPEDPATGSANGCLAGYLVRHGFFGPDRKRAPSS